MNKAAGNWLLSFTTVAPPGPGSAGGRADPPRGESRLPPGGLRRGVLERLLLDLPGGGPRRASKKGPRTLHGGSRSTAGAIAEPEHPYKRTPGRTRVVIVGDSISFGEGVDDERTFSALLEEYAKLEARGRQPRGGGIRHRSGARSCWTGKGSATRPDVVLLVFRGLFSDFTDNTSPARRSSTPGSRSPSLHLRTASGFSKHDEHVRLSPPRKVAQWPSFDCSFLYNRVRASLGLTRPPAPSRGVWADRVAAGSMQDLLPPARRGDVSAHPEDERPLPPGRGEVPRADPCRTGLRITTASGCSSSSCFTPLLQDITVVELGARYRAAGLAFDTFAGD